MTFSAKAFATLTALMLAAPASAEDLVFDLTGLEIGDTVRISAAKLPSDVAPTVDRDFVIATVAATGGMGADTEATAEA